MSQQPISGHTDVNDSAELVFIQDMLVFAVRDSAVVGLHACNLVFKIVGDREFINVDRV